MRKVCCCSSASCLISNCCIRSISAARSGSVCWSITCVCAARRAIQVLAICNDSSMTHISAFANYIVGWSDNMACLLPAAHLCHLLEPPILRMVQEFVDTSLRSSYISNASASRNGISASRSCMNIHVARPCSSPSLSRSHRRSL